jgi:alanine transaminase
MQYAVRGRLVMKADDYAEQLKNGGGSSLKFSEIIYCNIGNPQQVGQRPITFFRQVLSLLENPALLEHAAQIGIEEDAVARARYYLKALPTGTGAYTNSRGVAEIRDEICQFIESRDGGISAHREHVFLTNGASAGVKQWLSLVLTNPNDGVLIPIPQYPLYSATLQALGAQALPYYLDEANGWSLSGDELEAARERALAGGNDPRALAVINPGNPTGQVMSVESMRDVVAFCAAHKILLLADEVYQENVYGAREFFSFKKIASDMIAEGAIDALQLVSFHSTSKGYIGECGKRGGYFEAFGFGDDVLDEVYKCASVSLCPNVVGQFTTGLMVNPPKPGDASHARYVAERDDILGTLEKRASIMVNALNALEGVTCNEAEGAMYVFPRIELPSAAHTAAAGAGMPVDAYYASRLLDHTGILVVPGSGFGQVEGTFHFRTTFLPPLDRIERVAESLTEFHQAFLDEFK